MNMQTTPKAKHDYLVLRCTKKIWIRQRTSVDYDLHVLTPKAVPVPYYETMCAAIDDFIHDRFAEAILKDIEEIENGRSNFIENGTEAYIFWLTPELVTFEFQFGENGPDKSGEVTLAQFKLAVHTYLKFLRDPERKPIEVPFPV